MTTYDVSFILPSVGDVWHWEPLKPHASEEVTVTDLRFTNGDEWQIETVNAQGRRCWTDWSRFIEACVLITPTKDQA